MISVRHCLCFIWGSLLVDGQTWILSQGDGSFSCCAACSFPMTPDWTLAPYLIFLPVLQLSFGTGVPGFQCWLVYTFPWLWVLTPAQSLCQPGYNNLWNSATGDIWHRDHVPLSEKIKALPKPWPSAGWNGWAISANTVTRVCAFSKPCLAI